MTREIPVAEWGGEICNASTWLQDDNGAIYVVSKPQSHLSMSPN